MSRTPLRTARNASWRGLRGIIAVAILFRICEAPRALRTFNDASLEACWIQGLCVSSQTRAGSEARQLPRHWRLQLR